MLSNIKNTYGKEYDTYQKYYQKTMQLILVVGLLTALLAFGVAFYFEEFIIEQATTIAEQMQSDSSEQNHESQFMSTFSNNIWIGAVIIICGLIPIFGIPVLYALLSFAAVGIIAGYGMIMEYDVLKTILVSFVPHAIFEIIPILYSVAIGMYVNRNIMSKLFFKRRTSEPLRKMVVQSLVGYLIVVIPVFFVAALIESFVTTHLIEVFL